ncbi:hypothetical protein ACFX1R_036760 [Malus domestica]
MTLIPLSPSRPLSNYGVWWFVSLHCFGHLVQVVQLLPFRSPFEIKVQVFCYQNLFRMIEFVVPDGDDELKSKLKGKLHFAPQEDTDFLHNHILPIAAIILSVSTTTAYMAIVPIVTEDKIVELDDA